MAESRRYLPLLEELDRWQDAARADHPAVIPCHLGCSRCCLGPFDISVADVAAVVDAVGALAAPARAEIRDAAARQVQAMVALEPGWTPPFDIRSIGDARFDRISDALAEDPCPLLDAGGGCRIYHDRPMICRLMGLPLVTESGDVIENGCPIQDGFPRYAALPPRPFPLEAWERREAVALAGAAGDLLGDPSRTGYETTIAGAILSWLPAG